MTHDTLVNAVLGLHTAVLPFAVAAYLRYGDRTDHIPKALQGNGSLLATIRQQLVLGLRDHIKPAIAASATQMSSSILTADGNSYYREVPSDLADGEAFRDSLQEFVDEESQALLDLRKAVEARNRWLWYAKGLSWVLWVAGGWGVLVLGIVSLLEKMVGLALADGWLHAAWLTTAVFGMASFALLGCMQHQHDVLCDLRVQYEAP